VCHRTVSGAPGSYKSKLATFRFLWPRSAIIHRTVQCATGLSGAPSGATATSATVNCNGRLQHYNAWIVRAEVRAAARGAPDSEQCMSGAAPDCLVPLEDKGSNGRQRPDPNGWVTWLAHRTVRCAHRQQPPPTVVWWLRAINTPQPPPLQPSKHSTHCIQYKSNKTPLQRHNSSDLSAQSP
jgi:hypothetical protein